MWLLERRGDDFRAVYLVILALVLHAFLGPQAFHQLDFFFQLFVATFLGDNLALGVRIFLAEAGDQIDADTSFGQLIEGGEHLGLGDRVNEARLYRHQCFDFLRAGDNERGRHPGIPAEGGNGDQYIVEAGLFGGDGNPFEMLHGLRDAFARIAESSGVANSWNEPTHLQGFFIVHAWALFLEERWSHYSKTCTV
ncbi:hypothetical protein D3C77_431820 [compost metagenome]